MPRYCNLCGRENTDRARYCIGCGENLTPFWLDSRYEVLSLIKSGAMGCVYRARDARLNHIVALKKMLMSSSNQEDISYAEQRFLQEAQLLSQLHHGGLPKVSDFFTSTDARTNNRAHYLVMTFIDGRDLETIISERGAGNRFTVDEVLDYFRQILEILHYLHSRVPPVIYRDLKPSNIMKSNSRIFLVDFGIARIFTPQQKGTLIGTPGYASLEQYKGYAEPRSDLYSLGAVIHYLLTGLNPEDSSRPPFTFDPPSAVNPDVPGHIDSIVMSLLDVILENRPESAHHVLELLSKPLPGRTRRGKSSGASRNSAAKTTQLKGTRKPALKKVPPAAYNDIFEAICADDIQGVKKFCKAGTNLDEKNDKDTTPLHWAAYRGNLDIVKYLIKKGARVDSRDVDESTPLHVAVAGGSLEITEFLMAAGAQVNERDVEGLTPLHVAAQEGRQDLADCLIDWGAEVNAEGNTGYTPLHLAASGNSKEVASALVSMGARINAENDEGFTPLHRAVQEGHHEMVEFLLRRGACVNAPSQGESTPLHWAAYKGFRRIAELLVNEGADIYAEDEDHSTPLHVAAAGNSREIAGLLIAKGANINAVDSEGFSPLHVAVQEGHLEMVTFLLLANAVIDYPDNRGRTPLKLAVQLRKQEIAEALRTHGASK